MKAPSVTAAIRVYNAEAHVSQTLESILSQTRPPDEVLVIDDGSTDDTPGVLERFGGEIRVVRQDNRGYAGSFDRSVLEARGDYIANCDADDLWEPEKLERQVEALAGHPQIDLAFCGARFFGLTEGARAPYPQAGLLDRADFARSLYRRNYICTSSTLIRRELCLRVGGFTAKAAPCEDYDYWLRLVHAGAVSFYEPQVLVAYRTHASQVSSDLLRMHRSEHFVHSRQAAAAGDPALVRTVLARDLSNIARALSDRGDTDEARAAFRASFRHRPKARVLAWLVVLSSPERARRPLANRLVSLKRAIVPVASR